MIDKDRAQHYLWGANCEGWHLVQQPGVSVIQERMPPGTSEVRHWHRQARQFFYILSGVATLEVNGQRETLTAGQGLEIAPTVPHQIFNESAEAAEFLVISQPPSHGDRIVING